MGSTENKPSILIVDDDESTCKSLALIFKKKGYSVATAVTGGMALEQTKSTAYNLALLDIKLPDIDGIDLISQVKTIQPDIEICMATAYASKENAIKALNQGAGAYILKPFDMPEVLVTLDRLLEKQRLVIENRKLLEEVQLELAERKKAEEQILKLSQAVEQSASVVIITDTEGNIEYVNPKFVQVTGFSADEAVGKNPRFLNSGETAPKDYKALWSAIKAGREWRGEFHNKKKNGEYYWVLASISAIKNSDGNITNFLAIQEDITDHKAAQAELLESENRFRSMFEAAAIAVVLSDGEGKVNSWNGKAQQVFGYTKKELIGQPLTKLMPERYRDRHVRGMKRLATGGKAKIIGKTVELIGIKKDGSEFPIELSLSTWASGEEQHYAGMIRDLSNRKKLENELIQSEKMRAIGSLAAGIAHEINSPMQFIASNVRFMGKAIDQIVALFNQLQTAAVEVGDASENSELMESIFTEISTEKFEYQMQQFPKAVEQSIEGIDRITDIVKAMRVFSHPGGEEKIPTDLNDAIRSTAMVARNEWKYVANLETDLDPDLPPVLCFSGEINQVLLNLIVNAANAIESKVDGGSEAIDGVITISTRQEEDYVLILIQDTGIGIPEKVQPHIFEPFFTTKEVGKGTGQGLSIAHAIIVEKHGGSLTFETEEGKGTTFFVRLPKK